jgi:hypothetical protein
MIEPLSITLSTFRAIGHRTPYSEQFHDHTKNLHTLGKLIHRRDDVVDRLVTENQFPLGRFEIHIDRVNGDCVERTWRPTSACGLCR